MFNTVVNTCEVCGEEELTVRVLDVMKNTLEVEGNIITFNIALKRLAKMGNIVGCEGILIGMLNEGLEPNVVSYTTTIGACAKEGMKNPVMASVWLQRMRARNVQPNYHTYNTALAACLDGKVESTFIGSKIAAEMLEDAEKELACGLKVRLLTFAVCITYGLSASDPIVAHQIFYSGIGQIQINVARCIYESGGSTADEAIERELAQWGHRHDPCKDNNKGASAQVGRF